VLSVNRIRAFAATVVTLALVVPAAGLTATPARAGIPDVTALFTQALRLVHGTRLPTFRHAVMLEADGFTRTRRGVTSAAGIVGWRFALQNRSSRFPAAMVSYGPAPRRFGRVIGLGPKRLNPLYIFGLVHGFVAIDTVTGKVRPIH